jgi:hypothetical protein
MVVPLSNYGVEELKPAYVPIYTPLYSQLFMQLWKHSADAHCLPPGTWGVAIGVTHQHRPMSFGRRIT